VHQPATLGQGGRAERAEATGLQGRGALPAHLWAGLPTGS
jgi:hypothetical protein